MAFGGFSMLNRLSQRLSLSKMPKEEMNGQMNKELIEKIQCPICMQTMMNKVFVCCNGHSLCKECFDRLNNVPKECPQCKQSYSCCKDKNIRNLALEKLIFSTVLPCRYEDFGCQRHSVGTNRIKHFEECTFRPIQCPFACAILPLFDECLFATKCIDELMDHAESKHGFDIFENKNNEFQFALDDITDGSGHYRIILKSAKPKIECLLVGFKSQSGSIVLFCRALGSKFANMPYRIISSFVGVNGKIHSVQWRSQMLTTENEIGIEYNNGLLLKLSKEQVDMWMNDNVTDAELIPLKVIVG